MYKKVNVVMLPTNEKAHFGDIILTPFTKELLIFQHQNCTEVAKHLYITSDDKIKEGDWYYTAGLTMIFQATSFPLSCKDAKKIISTTDTNIMEDLARFRACLPYEKEKLHNSILPQPSPLFIGQFISAYNKGNIITEVKVEYDILDINSLTSDTKTYPNLNVETLIINPDNTINIKPIKDSWSREEIESLFLQLIKDCEEDSNLLCHYSGEYKDLNEWIEENL